MELKDGLVTEEWMSSSQAAATLGIKTTSLYAYVSRGVITRHVTVVDGRRVSRFTRHEVLALADQRARPRMGALTALIESDVTQLDADGRLAFRGIPVSTCATWGFERTAAHVLGHAVGSPLIGHIDSPSALAGGPLVRATDVVRAVVLALAGSDPERAAIDPGHCRYVAGATIEAAACTVTGLVSGTVAERLTEWWGAREGARHGSAGEPSEDAVRAVDVALSVLVDHELTASTLAARAAAGVRADPWMVLLTGLSAMSGRSQASASRSALDALRAWRDGALDVNNPPPGFGHKVYLGPDPRAELLLAEVSRIDATAGEAVDSLTVEVARAHGLYRNIDAALAALSLAARLPDDAGELIFTVARIPGLMAHAMEEYPHGLRLRPRALA